MWITMKINKLHESDGKWDVSQEGASGLFQNKTCVACGFSIIINDKHKRPQCIVFLQVYP